MNKGTVIEAGTHDSLIALNGAYKKLVEAQHLDQKNESLANSPKKLDDQLKKEAVTLQAAASSNQELDDTRDVESAGEERKNASMVSIFRKIRK